ncbi:MAG: hypothetical protein ABI488_18590 [Polyangiaceae bacterium]
MRKSRAIASLLPFVAAALPVLMPLACGNSDAPPAESGLPGGVFGGSGSGGAFEQPTLAGAPSTETDAGAANSTTPMAVCQDVPQGQLALIDDFEDGDAVAVPEVGREAYWFTVHDESAGTVVPDTNFLPVAGGAHGSAYAAHVTASGYSVWGAAFNVNITHFIDGIRCPFNASKFSGVRFFARGSGQVRVEPLVPAIVEQQYGGLCDPNVDTCYDSHGAWITLGAEWKLYSLPWSAFAQRGFGKAAAFTPESLLTLQFELETPQLPLDFWADDVSFEDGSATPSLGQGGEGGEGGEGGVNAAGASGERSGGAGAGGSSARQGGA